LLASLVVEDILKADLEFQKGALDAAPAGRTQPRVDDGKADAADSHKATGRGESLMLLEIKNE
jgi:hypothetical protein